MMSGKHFVNGYRPVNVYRNGLKLAGWNPVTKTGTGTVNFDDTYDDTANVKILGKTEIKSDYWQAGGQSTQVQTEQGKNLFDINKLFAARASTNIYATGTVTWDIDGSTVSFTTSTAFDGVGIKLKVNANTAYTLSVASCTFNRYVLYFLDSANSIISGTNYGQLIYTSFYPPDNTAYMYIMLANSTSGSFTFSNLQLELGSTATTYAPFVPNSPTPEYPSPIVNSIPEGWCKIQDAFGDWYEFYLPEMYGIGTVKDRVVVDFVSMNGWVDSWCGKKVYDGSADEIWVQESASSFYIGVPDAKGYYTIYGHTHLCSHYAKADNLNLSNYGSKFGPTSKNMNIKNIDYTSLTAFVNRLKIDPISITYQLATPTRTPITFTKNNASTAPTLPMAFLTSTPSADYPATPRGVGGWNGTKYAVPININGVVSTVLLDAPLMDGEHYDATIQTHYPTTTISVSTTVTPTIEATAKVMI